MINTKSFEDDIKDSLLGGGGNLPDTILRIIINY